MEVKLVITPSEEMVQLVDKVINAFAKKEQTPWDFAGKKKPEPTGDEVLKEEIEIAKAVIAEPKRRKTKAEIEAEKLAQQELAKGIEDAEKESTNEVLAEETPAEAPKTTFVADVVKLRKMTVRRSELIGDVPAKLLEFGYNSVTSLAKDAVAAEKYFNYLVSVSPISVEDNA